MYEQDMRHFVLLCDKMAHMVIKFVPSLIFHAGTVMHGQVLCTDGGRVLAITSMAENTEQARQKSYKTLEYINFQDMYYRRDIGNDLQL